MVKFEDMSRDELIKWASGAQKEITNMANSPAMTPCPFCRELGYVPYIKYAVKESLIGQWNTNVTTEEWEAYVLATVGPA